MLKRDFGFTLVEMMVTITILAILLALAVPNVSRTINENHVATGANEFAQALALAKRIAPDRGRPVTICRSLNADSDTPSCSNATSGGRGANDWSVGWIVFVEDSISANIGSFDGNDILLLKKGALPSPTSIFSSSTISSITINVSGLPRGIPPNSFPGAGIAFTGNNNAVRRLVCISPVGVVNVYSNMSACPANW